MIDDFFGVTCHKDTTATKESNAINDEPKRNSDAAVIQSEGKKTRELTTVIGGFASDGNIVRMTFSHPSIGNANKLRCLQFVDRC